MGRRSAADQIEALLVEQIAYYSARAPEYLETAFPEVAADEMKLARDEVHDRLEAFQATGDVLELACGPGSFTTDLLRHAHSVTAVDAAPEMLSLAREKIRDSRVTFIQADVFTWQPDRRYDVVFFGFWLSHVPLERFEAFWSLVDRALKPGGRVAFVDDAYRTPEELIEGEQSSTIRRRLGDGTEYRAVKVPHTPDSLEPQLEAIGWQIAITPVAGPFFWGEGGRAP
jgi:demethylmenaquinone methyltransferase/2-methoxy-6-polyprenyl-1,4-benzoquinol methylase